MPRITRSQAAALQNADGNDSTGSQSQREPFEEVNDNIKLAEPSRRITRARSKAGTRKENYDTEENPTPPVDRVGTSSHRAGTSVSNKSTRTTRSRVAKAPEVIVLDEVETIEVTTTRRTRSTRRTRQTAAGADNEQQPEDLALVAPQAPITRGRRADRDGLDGPPSKLSPSKIPSPIRPPPSPSPNAVGRLDETPSKSLTVGLFTKGPSPVPIGRSLTRSANKMTGEGSLAGRPAAKSPAAGSPIIKRSGVTEQQKEASVSTPLADRLAAVFPPSALITSTPISKAAPTTPATTKVKKPLVLGSPFSSSPSRKVVPRTPSSMKPLGSFASPTKAQLARRPTVLPPKSGPQNRTASGTSATVDVSQAGIEGQQLAHTTNSTDQDTPKQKVVPSVLVKKAPVVATTKAVLLRTQRATGKPVEPMIRIVGQKPDDTKTPAPQRPKDAVQQPVSSKPAVPIQPKFAIQRIEPSQSSVSPHTRPATIIANRKTPINYLGKTQVKATPESIAKTVTRPLHRTATTITSQPKQEGSKDTEPQKPVDSHISVATPKAQASALMKKPSIPTLAQAPGPSLSKKPSIPALPKNAVALSKKPSVSSLPKTTTTLSRKPSIPTLPKTPSIPALSKKPSVPILSKKPSIPTLPDATTGLARKPSVSILLKTTPSLTKKPSVPTLSNTTAVLSNKPSIPTIPKATIVVPPMAPAPASSEASKADETKPKEDEPAKTPKLATQKKPFQPVKSTKPLTVPIPFQYDLGNRAVRPTGQTNSPLSQATLPKSSTAVSGIKDRMKRFEAPKPKPAPLKDARTMLREMRKEARLGTLPKLTGEVVYAELPQLDDSVTFAAPVLPQKAPIEPLLEAVVSEPVAIPAAVVPATANNPPAPSPTKMVHSEQFSPTKLSTHDIVVVSGLTNVSPQRTVPYEDWEKLKIAKDRAEAYARGTKAVVNWAAQEMVKRNAEAATRR